MPALIEGKDLDPDDKAYIAKQVAENNQDIYFQDWVVLYYQDKEPKKRILVVTNFRVLTIKVNVLGRSVRQSFPILDLSRMQVSKENLKQLTLEFGAGYSTATVQYESSVMPIAQTILFSYQAVTFGRPAPLLPKMELPAEFLSTFLPPEPDEQDGLLASYLAECDYNKLEARLPVLDYLMTCFQLNDHVLDLGECLAFVEKELKTDIHALASALRFSKWFNEVIVAEFPIKNEGITSLANLLTIPTQIAKLILVNCKAGKTGFAAFAKALGKGTHSLTFLNLSKNKLDDPGIKMIAEGLAEGKKVLSTLCLRNCAFSAKGVKSLTTLLEQPNWLAGLSILDVSDNRMGKDGTKALAQWLEKPGCALEQLYVVSSDLDTDILFEALQANKKLSNNHLKTLNVSGNKMTKKAISSLSAVMETTGSLSMIYLSNAGISRQFFTGILDAGLKNKVPGMSFQLDFSRNDLTVRGAKDLDTLLMDWLKREQKVVTEAGKIHTLVLSDNNLGIEGVTTVCKALRGTSVYSLGLDRNVKLGVFEKGVEVGEALAALIQSTPMLKELTVSGNDSFNLKGTALIPLLSALSKNTSLQLLDISHNRLGDQVTLKLAESLAENTSLRSFNIDGNKLSFKVLQALHESAKVNKSLVDWVIPMEEISKILKGASEKKVRELRQLVHDLETFMDRNEQALRAQGESKSGKDFEFRIRAASRLGAMDDPMMSLHRKTASRLFDTIVQQNAMGYNSRVSTVDESKGPASPRSKSPPPREPGSPGGAAAVSSPKAQQPTPKMKLEGELSLDAKYDDWTAAAYTFEQLATGELPAGVDPSQRELYLEASKFMEIFGVSKDEYSKMPKWRQTDLKKKHKIFA